MQEFVSVYPVTAKCHSFKYLHCNSRCKSIILFYIEVWSLVFFGFFFNVVYIFRSNVKEYWYKWGEGTDKPCQVRNLEEKIPYWSGQCVPSSCLIAIKECICFSSLTVLDICIYVMHVSQLPSCFSSATNSKASEQQKLLLQHHLKCIQLFTGQNGP